MPPNAAPSSAPSGFTAPPGGKPGGGPPGGKMPMMSGGAPGGGAGPGGPDAPPLNFGVIARRGSEFLGRRPWMLVGYIVGSLLTTAVLPPLISLRFSELTRLANPHELPGTYTFWVGMTILLIVLNFGLRYLTTSLDVSVSNSLRRSVFLNILRQSPRFFHEHDTGQLTMIVNQFCIEAEMGLRQLLVDPILQVLGIISVGWALYGQLSQSSQAQGGHQVAIIFGLVAVMALLSPWLVARMGLRLQRSMGLQQQQALTLSTLINGAVSAPEEIQAMRAEQLFDHKHSVLLQNNLAARIAGSVTLEKLNLLNRLPGDVVLFTLLGAAVYFAIHGGGMGPGTFVAVALLTPQFMQAVQSLGGFSITASLRWPSIQLIDSILSSKPTTGEDSLPAGTAQIPESTELPTLEARDVVFSYRAGELPNVLDHVSFNLPPGKVTGFIARAGQGKTTFFRLALRFYDPQGGQIILDEHVHSSLPVAELRREIVLMAQFPAFFIDTVRENFLVANPAATDDDIRRLCELTPLWEKLVSCFGPNPLDAPFQAGGPLSGGFKKLFALTRCLLRQPRYLFLDEPTTGMDPEVKFEFIEPMRRNCAGKTTLVVDHDILWQLRFCDNFIVLDKGKLVQQGTGMELLNQPGVFRELFDEQTQVIRDLAGVMDLIKATPGAPAAVPAEIIEAKVAETV